jgi:hypothetical protein
MLLYFFRNGTVTKRNGKQNERKNQKQTKLERTGTESNKLKKQINPKYTGKTVKLYYFRNGTVTEKHANMQIWIHWNFHFTILSENHTLLQKNGAKLRDSCVIVVTSPQGCRLWFCNVV